MDPEIELNAVLLWDGSDFGRVNGAKGLARMLSREEAQAARSRQRRYRQPTPPRIQIVLKRAHELKARLAADPELTRDAMAKEAGLNPSHLTRLLHLVDLAPEIQQYILAMPPTVGRSLITERRLRSIARIEEHREQLQRFHSLLALPADTSKGLPAATPLSSQQHSAHLGA